VKKILILALITTIGLSLAAVYSAAEFHSSAMTPKLIAFPTKEKVTLISNINVIDVETGNTRFSQDINIQAGRIYSINNHQDQSDKSKTHTINGQGKFIIPGLWDMHVHSSKLSPVFDHPLFIAHGVTGVRDMSGCVFRSDYILQSSYFTNGGDKVPKTYPDFFKLKNKMHAKKLVEHYNSSGHDFIKVYSDLNLEQYKNLAQAAKKQKMYIAGHKPFRIPLTQAIASGQRSIEHPWLFIFECLDHPDYLNFRTEYRALFRQSDASLQAKKIDLVKRLKDNHNIEECKHKMQQMGQSETWWVPTLQVLSMPAQANRLLEKNDLRLQHAPSLLKHMMWYPDLNQQIESDVIIDEQPASQMLLEMSKICNQPLSCPQNSLQ